MKEKENKYEENIHVYAFLALFLMHAVFWSILITDYIETAHGQDFNTDSDIVSVINAPLMHDPGDIFSGSIGIESAMYGEILQAPEPIIPGQFTFSQIQRLKEAQAGEFSRRYPGVKELKFLSGRSVQEELELYRISIGLHERALREGKHSSYYIDLLSEGKTIVEDMAFINQLPQIRRDLDVCGNGFEIYPNSGLCSQFGTHQEAEQHYYHSKLTVYQLGIRNGELESMCGHGANKEKACNNIGWGGPNIWKAQSDTRPNQGVVLLNQNYCDGAGNSLISGFRIEDALGGEAASSSFDICNKANGGRAHYRFSPAGRNLNGPVFVRYDFNGKEECRRVDNPGQDQR